MYLSSGSPERPGWASTVVTHGLWISACDADKVLNYLALVVGHDSCWFGRVVVRGGRMRKDGGDGGLFGGVKRKWEGSRAPGLLQTT